LKLSIGSKPLLDDKFFGDPSFLGNY
jgi:hypothetical protein